MFRACAYSFGPDTLNMYILQYRTAQSHLHMRHQGIHYDLTDAGLIDLDSSMHCFMSPLMKYLLS